MVNLYRIVKRIVDFFAAFILIILISPILVILSLILRFLAGSPIIFTSERVGKRKRIFRAYKFRTLITGIKRKKHGLSKAISSCKLAEFLRATHIDEILQLFNILKGDMNFIGPRPLDVPRYNYLKAKDPSWRNILKIRPGLTCLNQVARYSDWGMDKVRKLKDMGHVEKRNRLMLDKYYIKHESFILDVKITFWTTEYLFIGFFKKLFRLNGY